jgi:uncharacterized protein DUF5317
MRLILLTVSAALAAGFIAGGSLRDFPAVKVRWWGLAFAGVAMQLLTVGGALETVLLIGSLLLLIVFVVANVRAPGFTLILIGLALNATVITLNQGMPISRDALVASGQADTLTELETNDDGQKHFLDDGHAVLLPLGDVIGVGPPVRQVISIGDVFVQLGVGWFIVIAMRRPETANAQEPEAADT